ncbi:MAG: helix-turn-helix domain-containing protein [Saprospiraceae bacterium]|nr:helix-turn-helix domain-containing protein [Saprospiraceae bacterium]
MKSQTFGEKIKELRVDLNYSLKWVGNTIGYSPKLLSKIEKNEKKAPEQIIKALSKIYKIPYKDLVTKYLSEEIYYQIRSCEYADEVLNIVKRRLKKEGEGTQREETKEKIIESIKTYFSDKPIEKAWIFGSFARNASISKDSDIDIMVVFKKPNKISLFDLIQMKKELTQKTGRAVDLIEEGQELSSFRDTIKKERRLVYGSKTN